MTQANVSNPAPGDRTLDQPTIGTGRGPWLRLMPHWAIMILYIDAFWASDTSNHDFIDLRHSLGDGVSITRPPSSPQACFLAPIFGGVDQVNCILLLLLVSLRWKIEAVTRSWPLVKTQACESPGYNGSQPTIWRMLNRRPIGRKKKKVGMQRSWEFIRRKHLFSTVHVLACLKFCLVQAKFVFGFIRG